MFDSSPMNWREKHQKRSGDTDKPRRRQKEGPAVANLGQDTPL